MDRFLQSENQKVSGRKRRAARGKQTGRGVSAPEKGYRALPHIYYTIGSGKTLENEMNSTMRKTLMLRWKNWGICGDKRKFQKSQKFFQKKLAFAAPPCYNKQALRSADNTKQNMGVFPSGQRGQTVNLLLIASVVRIHPLPPERDAQLSIAFLFAQIIPGRCTVRNIYSMFTICQIKGRPALVC